VGGFSWLPSFQQRPHTSGSPKHSAAFPRHSGPIPRDRLVSSVNHLPQQQQLSFDRLRTYHGNRMKSPTVLTNSWTATGAKREYHTPDRESCPASLSLSLHARWCRRTGLPFCGGISMTLTQSM
jgi:hypothetical protein